MVRIKHRYLLLNILYPNDKPPSVSKPDQEVPWTVQFRQPSPDRLDAKLLARMIRDGVSELFGDYGSGMVASSLQGKDLPNGIPVAGAAANLIQSSIYPLLLLRPLSECRAHITAWCGLH